jgi:branched-chain amino acid transport system permease protein
VPGIVAVLVFSAALGVVIQLIFIRPLMGQSLLTLVMATIALSTIIEALVSIIYGSADRNLASTLPNSVIHAGGVRISTLDLIIIGISFGCMILFGIFFRFTRLGLQMRATAENPEAAALSGVNSQRVFRVTFAVAAALASLGGVLLANLQLVSLDLGDIGLIAFPAAVVGGLTSIPGAVVGGILIGVIESLTAGYISTSAQDVFVYLILLLVLLVRPGGIFGGRAVVRV